MTWITTAVLVLTRSRVSGSMRRCTIHSSPNVKANPTAMNTAHSAGIGRKSNRSINVFTVPADCPYSSEPGLEPRRHRLGCLLGVLDRFEQHLGDVLHPDVLVALLLLHTVVHHHVAERARHRDPARTGGERLLGALDVHLLARVLLHPHARATGAAAQTAGPVARHLDHVDAAERADHVAGREVHVVVAAQVARVVVRDPLLE